MEWHFKSFSKKSPFPLWGLSYQVKWEKFKISKWKELIKNFWLRENKIGISVKYKKPIMFHFRIIWIHNDQLKAVTANAAGALI